MYLFINLIRNVKLLKTDKSYTKIETMFYLWVPTSWIFILKDIVVDWSFANLTLCHNPLDIVKKIDTTNI